ncbi:MAG: hypothetical protein ABI399_07385 [Bauldia sp.]
MPTRAPTAGAMMPHRIFQHGDFETLAEGVWLLRGTVPAPVHRNMVVVRLASGALLLHSVIALTDERMAALGRLGRPAYAIVPSLHHMMDAPFYKTRFPDITMLCPAPIRATAAGRVTIDATVEAVLATLGIRLHPVPATRSFEYVYDMPMPEGGRMLVFNDALGNRGAPTKGLLGFLFGKLLWVAGEGPDLSRLYRLTQSRDTAAIRRFAAGLGGIPDLRLVTFSHGDPLTENPGAALKRLGEKA